MVWIGRIVSVLVITAFGAGVLHGQAPQTKGPAFWTHFDRDDDDLKMEDAQPPSDAVLRALLNTPEAREMRGDLNKLDPTAERRLFGVFKVQLKGVSEIDEVVIGNVPMNGGDNDWFWVVRDMRDRAKVLLWVHANGFDFLNKTTKGYPDVESYWSSAAGYSIHDVYRYDGNTYRLAREINRKLKL